MGNVDETLSYVTESTRRRVNWSGEVPSNLQAAATVVVVVTRLPRAISLSLLCHSIFSPYHESEGNLDQTAERGMIFLAAKGLYVTFQSFSEPKLSSLSQHLRYLLLSLALNRLRDAEEYLPMIALPTHAALLSLSSFGTPLCRFVRARLLYVLNVNHPPTSRNPSSSSLQHRHYSPSSCLSL